MANSAWGPMYEELPTNSHGEARLRLIALAAVIFLAAGGPSLTAQSVTPAPTAAEPSSENIEPQGKTAETPPSASAAKEEGTPAVVLDDHRVESLLGKEVKGAEGEDLGRIVDVLVSRDGTLSAAVIDFGGFLGVGTRKVAVAWSALQFADQGPVLKMTRDELRVTPEYRAGEPVVVVGSAAPKDTKPPGPATDPPSRDK